MRKTNPPNELWAELRRVRLERGWTYRQTAHYITALTGRKISANTIRNWISGSVEKPQEIKTHLVATALAGIAREDNHARTV
jgi:transcriptional regulator with XRE-family HTH domain